MPAAQYKQDIQPDNRICVTVTFQTPILSSNGPPVVMTTGVESLDGALAEYTAAVSAIRLVEAATDTVIGDVSYGHLRQLDRENSRLRKQVELSKQLLKRTNIKAKKLARGWFCSVRRMFSFSSQFRNVALIANFGSQEPLDDDVKAAFATIYEAALQMELKSRNLENKLEEIRRS